MTPDSRRQDWLYNLKGLSGNKMGGSEDPQPSPPYCHHYTHTHTHTPLWQTGRIMELNMQLAGHSSIKLIKCKCISWGRNWGGIEGNYSLTGMHFSDQLGSIRGGGLQTE